MDLIISDGGRRAAGFKGHCEDCVVRAIAIAARRPYEEVYKECALMNAEYSKTTLPNRRFAGVRTARNGVYTSHERFADYINRMGFVRYPPRGQGQSKKLYLRDGDLPMGRVIAELSRHWVAVIDGVIHDTYDSQIPYYNWTLRRVYKCWKLDDDGILANNAIADAV